VFKKCGIYKMVKEISKGVLEASPSIDGLWDNKARMATSRKL
jgi:hypothetical protein